MNSKIIGLKPGIYIGLSNELYQNDPAISRSDIMNLIDTPRTYWEQSFMNPERKRRKPSEGMEYGEAFHCLMFEPREFEKRYQVVPIDAWSDHKKKIDHELYFKIAESIKVLKEGKETRLFVDNGYSEVTIIFDYDGIRFRTRHDRFLPHVTMDYKTSFSIDIPHIKRAFWQYGYDVQAYMYRLSRTMFKQQYAAGEAKVYGDMDKEFFHNFLKDEMNGFVDIIQRNTEPYPYRSLLISEDTFDNGGDRFHKGMEVYRKYMNKYGCEKWPACDGMVKEFSMFMGIDGD